MAVVTDMSPLNEPRRWAHEVAEELATTGKGTPLFQVMCSTGTVQSMCTTVALCMQHTFNSTRFCLAGPSVL